MKTKLAFGSLLLSTSLLVAPAALAQTAGATGDAATGGQQDASATQQTEQDQPTEDQVEISTPGAEGASEIVVTGRFIPNAIRATSQVVSVVSSEDIARTGEGDIAGALQRAAGLDVVGNGYVYVRGLGDRYSSSLLNGSPLPSPEPLKRVVPLDIFPTNVIASALVQKTYSVNYPGEFGGGVINLTTRAVPEEPFFQLGGTFGVDTETTSELGYVYDGGSADWTGYDSDEREVPRAIKQAGANQQNLSPEQTAQLTNAETTLLQTNYHIPANWATQFSTGTSIDMGGGRVGVIAGGGFKNTWQTRATLQQSALDESGTLASSFDKVLTDDRAIANGLLGLGAEFGDQKIRFTNLYIHDTVKQASLASGTLQNNLQTPDGVDPYIQQTTSWFERQLFDSQLVGEFKFGDFGLDLRGSYANTKRKSPYEREFQYEYSSAVGDYVNRLGGNSYARVKFSDLNEDLWSGAVDLSYALPTARPITLSAGYSYADTDRTSSRFSFLYCANLPSCNALGNLPAQGRPDYLLSDLSLSANEIGLLFEPNEAGVGASPIYSGELTVHGAYGQVEAEVADGLRGTIGVRYETGREQIVTSQPYAPIKNDYWLPAATITWNFAPDMQIRLAGSKTIARPQFRELAPQTFQDYESNRIFYGNPYLRDSELWNAEARYEWYFGEDQRLSLAGFYKKIDNPIEAAAFYAGSPTIQTGFTNAPSAELYGAEVELQKYFPLDSLGGDFFSTRRLLFIANYTYTQSSIEAGDEMIPDIIQGGGEVRLSRAADLLQDGAPLTGQSDHLANVQFGIEDTERLSQLTVMGRYASKRVTNRGPVVSGVRLNDIYEEPGFQLDVVARQGVNFGGAEFELKFEARNLLHEDYEEYQNVDAGGRVYLNRYDLGRIFEIGLSMKI
ncbi:TonB-dependent receptor domain-containing protein [Stakelama saccharophila]|uniref:TonB-dependent receptor n=1 Tax=Stakelama saccharophila TaxID=3075605 RepID=A0ABZ0B6X0_9SPHN|nr:TonB-dependent receptor [Stakelama sp. W311]WNO52613.1 TonB-dependent receptor [Stakelama sp. W311]